MPNEESKGSSYRDKFLWYITGYSQLDGTLYRDAIEQFHNEVDGLVHSLFPPRKVPYRESGRFTYEQDYFLIQYPDTNVRIILEEHFLAEHSYRNSGPYGGNDDLADFFGEALHHLLVYGQSYYALHWEPLSIRKTTLVLPREIKHLDLPTVKKTWTGYRQQYSLVTYLFDPLFRDRFGRWRPARIYRFEPDEILELRYPFGTRPPVALTRKYLPRLDRFWAHSSDRSRAAAEPENFSLELEKARYTSASDQRKRYLLTKNKVRRIFGNVLHSDSKMTQYYDLYTVLQHKKRLNDLRSYLVGEFNRQIMARLAQKNNFHSNPELKLRHIVTNEELDEIWRAYLEGDITFDDFIEKVVRRT